MAHARPVKSCLLGCALLATGCGALIGANFDRPGGLQDAGAADGPTACVADAAASCIGKCGETMDQCGNTVQCRACEAESGCESGGPAACSGQGAVLFGGYGVEGDGGLGDLSETWMWNGAAWNALSVQGPSARVYAMMAPLNGNLVLYGGRTSVDGYAVPLSDTWTWDGAAWTPLIHVSGPSARYGSVMAPLGGKLVLFGGVGHDDAGSVDLSDTWTWDGAVWAELAVQGPPARAFAVMAPFNGQLFLFGGEDPSGQPLADAWTWDGAAWTEVTLTAGPPARLEAVMAPLGGDLVLFGGYDGAQRLSDTWTWNGTAWTPVTGLSSVPLARDTAMMAPAYATLVLFGGVTDSDGGTNRLSDTWTWDGAAWAQLSVEGPSAREQAVMANP
jgi:hypothetical protein